MFRSRLWRSLLLLFGMFVVLYLTASLYLPSSRRLIVGVDRRSGRVRQVEQRLTFLPPHQFYRLAFDKREGFAQRDGLTRIVSQDGVPVMVNYRLRFAIAGDQIPDVRRLVNDGFTTCMHARVTESVETSQPTVGPLVWAAVAAGLPPDRHGVIDFIDRARNVPVDANTRRAPALWDIAEAFGRESVVVNWWTDWPPTSLTATVFDTPGALMTNAVSPPDMQRTATSFSVSLQTVGYDQVHRFLNITPAE